MIQHQVFIGACTSCHVQLKQKKEEELLKEQKAKEEEEQRQEKEVCDSGTTWKGATRRTCVCYSIVTPSGSS